MNKNISIFVQNKDRMRTDIRTKKMVLIEDLVHMKNERLLDELSILLKKDKEKTTHAKKNVLDFVGIMSKSEGAEFKKIIEEGCEKIDYNEWK